MSADLKPTTIERAYEMARSGKAATIEQIIKCLEYEGYFQVRSQLTGVALRKTLNALCKASFPPLSG